MFPPEAKLRSCQKCTSTVCVVVYFALLFFVWLCFFICFSRVGYSILHKVDLISCRFVILFFFLSFFLSSCLRFFLSYCSSFFLSSFLPSFRPFLSFFSLFSFWPPVFSSSSFPSSVLSLFVFCVSSFIRFFLSFILSFFFSFFFSNAVSRFAFPHCWKECGSVVVWLTVQFFVHVYFVRV